MSRIILQFTKEGDTSLVRGEPSTASSIRTRISWEHPNGKEQNLKLDLDCNNVKPRLDNENGWISMRNDF